MGRNLSVEVELVGGPHDGARLTTALRLPFVWTNGSRCYRAASRGRALYRAMSPLMHGVTVSRFRFIGNTHAVCSCGALRLTDRKCGICGEALVTNG